MLLYTQLVITLKLLQTELSFSQGKPGTTVQQGGLAQHFVVLNQFFTVGFWAPNFFDPSHCKFEEKIMIYKVKIITYKGCGDIASSLMRDLVLNQ